MYENTTLPKVRHIRAKLAQTCYRLFAMSLSFWIVAAGAAILANELLWLWNHRPSKPHTGPFYGEVPWDVAVAEAQEFQAKRRQRRFILTALAVVLVVVGIVIANY